MMSIRLIGLFILAGLLAACTLGASSPESEAVQTLSATEAPASLITIIPPTAIQETPPDERQPVDDTVGTGANDTGQSQPGAVTQPETQRENCPVPDNYETYTVVSGDTLFGIAQRTETTVENLVQSNCLENADVLDIGQELWVPPISGGLVAPTNNQLRVTPIVENRDGIVIVQPYTTITISWRDVPENSLVSFTAHNFLVDGGVIPLAEFPGTGPQGATIDFQVPSEFNGSIEAAARLPGQQGSILQAETLLLQTAGFDDGPCRFVPHALGELGFVYTQPTLNSSQLGQVAFDGRYPITEVQTDAEGTAFYRITFNNQQGWVSSNKGALRGECDTFE